MQGIPLFSVLIANYNNGRYLSEAINSVIQQSYPNWELIIVDDCSTDNSEEVYSSFQKESRIHVFRNLQNMKCGYTKRRCVELANSELCGFLDADDVLLPNALEIMVRAHFENPGKSVITSRHYNCDERLSIISESRFLEIPEGLDYFTNGDYQVEHFAAFRKSCYLKTEGISSNKPRAIDQELYLKLEEVAPLMAINDLTYKYRIYDGSISHGESGMSAYVWNILVRYEACIRRNLDISRYSIGDLENKLTKYKLSLENAYNSKRYKVGSIILKPISLIRSLFYTK